MKKKIFILGTAIVLGFVLFSHFRVIDWSNAKAHVGKVVTIEGLVVSTHNEQNKQVFLNVGRPYPNEDRFTILIWGESLKNFPEDPAETYKAKTVRVKGKVELYEGVPEIIIDGPEDIEIVNGNKN